MTQTCRDELHRAQRLTRVENFREHGLLLLDGFVPQDVFETLRAEAKQARSAAWVCQRGPGDAPPLQRNHRAELGPAARALVDCDEMRALVHGVCGLSVQVSYEASCFTYYGEGDFLEAHEDRPQSCLLTFLLYVQAEWHEGVGPGPGLSLKVHAPGGEVSVPSKPGRALLLQGSAVPHGRPRLWPGESVSMLAACFKKEVDA